jgi:hypothetical protein
VAIRKVNAITGRGCAEAQEASRDSQLSASGIQASAATQGERNGVHRRNTFDASLPIRAHLIACQDASA